MSKQKIALSMIAKGDEYTANLLDRALRYVAAHVDEINITASYVKEKSETKYIEDVVKKYNGNLSLYKWNNNFSDARNFNFSQVSKNIDWIFWIDTDDVVRNAHRLKEVVEYAEKSNYDSVLAWYLYDFDEYKNCTVKHRQIRLVKNEDFINGNTKWAGALHEGFASKRAPITLMVEIFEVLHIKDSKGKDDTAKRNYIICKEQETILPKDPRTWWNSGAASIGVGKHKESIRALKKFLKMTESEGESYLAYIRMGASYAHLGDFETSKAMTFKAMMIHPHYPDAYLDLGKFFYEQKDWKKSKEFFVMGLVKENPKRDIIFYNPRDYDFNPSYQLAVVYMQLGQFENALTLIENPCLKMYPKHPEALQFRDLLKEEVDKLNKTERLAQGLKEVKTKKELKEKIEKLPADVRSHPMITSLYNSSFIKTGTNGNELAIYCNETDFIWDPERVKKVGGGGSEEAVVNLSDLLAELGWDVTVYASIGNEEKRFGKVMWKPFWMFNYRNENDVVIAWRSPALFDLEINAKVKVVWLHDVIAKEEFTKKRIENMDYLFCLTEWHSSIFPNVPKEKKFITSNGLNVKEFDKPVEKIPNNFIWTSSYDRGLDCLLSMWKEIRKQVPDATLDIYYGWNNFDSWHKNDQNKLNWKKEVIKQLKELKAYGVIEHGRIPAHKLADEYLKAEVWAYPTEWTETYCITAIKAQLAGAIPVTTRIAALEETSKYGEMLNVKDIYSNKRAQKEFVKMVVRVCHNRDKYPVEEMKKWAGSLTWDVVADSWDKLFKGHLKNNK